MSITMQLRKAAGILGWSVLLLFLFLNFNTLVNLTSEDNLARVSVTSNVPSDSIIGPSGVGMPIVLQINQGEQSVVADVKQVHTRIDEKQVSDSFSQKNGAIWLDQTNATPFVENGKHSLSFEITFRDGSKAIHEQAFETDYVPPHVTIYSQTFSGAVFSIEDDDSPIRAEHVTAYRVEANGDVDWSADAGLHCQSLSEKKMDCEFAPRTPVGEWVVVYQDAVHNKGSVSFGEESVNELQLRAAERNMEKMREQAHQAREENDTALFQAAGTCTHPKVDYYIFHTTGDLPGSNWTLQKKINFAKNAKQDIQDVYDAGLTAKGFAAVPLGTSRIVVLVKEGTSLTGITGYDEVIYIPNALLPLPNGPKKCDNPYNVCFEWGDLGTAVHAASPAQAIMTTKEYSTIGEIENTRKISSNVLMIIIDGKLNATAQALAFAGSAYIDFTKLYKPGNVVYQTDFSRIVAHEMGHLLGMDDLDILQNQLMTSSASGTFATDMDFHTAARIKTILCTDKQKPASLGIVETAASYGQYRYANYLLGREVGDLEECEVNYSGVIEPNNFATATHQDFYCVATKYDGGIIDPPVAVTNGAGANNVNTIRALYPGVIIKACQGPNTTSPGTCLPVGGGGSTGGGTICNGTTCVSETRPTTPKSPVSDPVVPNPNHCNNFEPGDGIPPALCPTTAYCPPNMKCAAQGGDCRCIPDTIIGCGNGFVESGEECDPPGSVCNGFCMGGAWMVAYCSSTCTCEFPNTPQPTELQCQISQV